jgi:hypothetical protein
MSKAIPLASLLTSFNNHISILPIPIFLFDLPLHRHHILTRLLVDILNILLYLIDSTLDAIITVGQYLFIHFFFRIWILLNRNKHFITIRKFRPFVETYIEIFPKT